MPHQHLHYHSVLRVPSRERSWSPLRSWSCSLRTGLFPSYYKIPAQDLYPSQDWSPGLSGAERSASRHRAHLVSGNRRRRLRCRDIRHLGDRCRPVVGRSHMGHETSHQKVWSEVMEVGEVFILWRTKVKTKHNMSVCFVFRKTQRSFSSNDPKCSPILLLTP